MTSPADAPALPGTARRPWITKWAKYAAASMSGVVTSTATLFVLLEVVDMAPVPANIIAVTLGAIPNYLVNRAWTFLLSFGRQLIVNYRNQSVEGLALPFLINWLLGDISNLVGCILTHQLPFQVRYPCPVPT